MCSVIDSCLSCNATQILSRTIPWSDSYPDSLVGKKPGLRNRAERGLHNVLYDYGVERHRASRRKRERFLVADLVKGVHVCCAALLRDMLILPGAVRFLGNPGRRCGGGG